MNEQNELSALREEKIASRLIFDGRVVHLYVDRVRLPDGREAERESARSASCRSTATETSAASASTATRTPRS